MDVTEWECNNCDWTGIEPRIIAGESRGTTVDVIDILCPKCSGRPVFNGTEREIDAWWDTWEKENMG